MKFVVCKLCKSESPVHNSENIEHWEPCEFCGSKDYYVNLKKGPRAKQSPTHLHDGIKYPANHTECPWNQRGEFEVGNVVDESPNLTQVILEKIEGFTIKHDGRS